MRVNNIFPATINEMALRVHKANRKWWPEDVKTRNKGEALMLMISELAECLEGASRYSKTAQ